MTGNPIQTIKTILARLLNQHILGAEKVRNFQASADILISGLEIDKIDLIKVLQNLEEKRIIEDFCLLKSVKNGFRFMDITPVQNSFDKVGISVPSDFRKIGAEYIETFFGMKSETAQNAAFLYLDMDGNFYHTDKNIFCYPMKRAPKALAIMRFLIENKGYQSTEALASVSNKSKQQLRLEIGNIKKKIEGHLDLDDVIETDHVGHSGYRINPKYKVR